MEAAYYAMQERAETEAERDALRAPPEPTATRPTWAMASTTPRATPMPSRRSTACSGWAVIDPDDMPPHPEDDHEALAREHAARVEAARIHHAREAQLPCPAPSPHPSTGCSPGCASPSSTRPTRPVVQAERRAREARERRALRALADARDIPRRAPARGGARPVAGGHVGHAPRPRGGRMARAPTPRGAAGAVRCARRGQVGRPRVVLLCGTGPARPASGRPCGYTPRRSRPAPGGRSPRCCGSGGSACPAVPRRSRRRDVRPAVVQGCCSTRWDAGLVTLASTNAMWPEWSARYLGAARATACGTGSSPRRARRGRPRGCGPS